MAMGKKKQRQASLWVESARLAKGPSHPFYGRLNQILGRRGFDGFVEGVCQQFYSERVGRPSLAPAVYFRMLLVGYFEGIDSERGIAWRVEANAALRSIVRRDTGESYQDFLTRLAQASGIETPTREDLARLDRNRPKKGSKDDWQRPDRE